MSDDRKFEILGVLLLAVTTLLFLALTTDGYLGESSRPVLPLSELMDAPNVLGEPGALVAGILYVLLGHAAHTIYVVTCIWGMMLIRHQPIDRFAGRFAGTLLLTFSMAAILDINLAAPGRLVGGTIGAFFGSLLEPAFGAIGANVVAVTLSLVGVLLATEFLFVRMAHAAVNGTLLAIRTLRELYHDFSERLAARREYQAMRRAERSVRVLDVDDAQTARKKKDHIEAWKEAQPDPEDLSRIKVRPVEQELPFDDASAKPAAETSAAKAQPEEASAAPAPAKPEPKKDAPAKKLRRKTVDEELPPDYEYPRRYTKPALSMLEEPAASSNTESFEELQKVGLLLEETLQTFGIEARVTDVTRGPTITRFEVEPAPGIKVSRFMSLADDLALALKAHRVRVEAPIPGKGRVGIEVPNDVRDSVVIRELLESRAWQKNKDPLPLALGKDIAGDVVVADLATMPHLLVAGATGAGKTICVKTLLASLLFNRTPDDLQLMLIDPKMVELSIFNDIPHLITPVVIDPKKASSALNWLINEMEERYRLFAHLRVRNIEVYNESVDNGEIELHDEDGEEGDNLSAIRKLPYIVCIIDELADLMMLARAEVEDAIGRLAQLARAVGIHLIIATQRPSVDVLTGVIKANFPSRISFQVSSRVDSRCILDEIGAERLIGRGDMLYLPPGQSKPTRVQGAFVSDEEMNSLISYLKTQAPPQYRDEIARFGQKSDGVGDLTDEDDELFDEAVKVVLETGQASISMVQRRLRVGYTRAARLIDMMELRGIVGPHIGSKAREILVSRDQQDNEVA